MREGTNSVSIQMCINSIRIRILASPREGPAGRKGGGSQSHFDKPDSLTREKALRGRFFLRSDSFHRQSVHRLAGLVGQQEGCRFFKREICAFFTLPLTDIPL
jgi:hypothetical protein